MISRAALMPHQPDSPPPLLADLPDPLGAVLDHVALFDEPQANELRPVPPADIT